MQSEYLDGEIVGALARGYCTKENGSKIVDPTLIEAMAKEVTPIVSRLQSENKELRRKTNFTYCAYCGKEFPLDADGTQIGVHINVCDKHPLGNMVRELQSQLSRMSKSAGECPNCKEKIWKNGEI